MYRHSVLIVYVYWWFSSIFFHCRIPFSVDDISNSIEDIDLDDFEPPTELKENPGFLFLSSQGTWTNNVIMKIEKPPSHATFVQYQFMYIFSLQPFLHSFYFLIYTYLVYLILFHFACRFIYQTKEHIGSTPCYNFFIFLLIQDTILSWGWVLHCFKI